MKQFWRIFGWAVTIAAQILLSFVLVELFKMWIVPVSIKTLDAFLILASTIWFSFLVGVFGIGVLSLVIRKMQPYHTLIRLFGTLIMALIPVVILVFLGLSVGLENEIDFQEIVLARMVPYYTQLNIVFSLLGFYLPTWFKKFSPQKA
jgi:hypothetical protein